MLGEWDVAFRIESPAGTWLLNQATRSDGTGWFLLDASKCTAGLPARVTDDDIPQGHGKIVHARWWSGYQMHLALSFWERPGDDGSPACGTLLREMLDEAGLHIASLLNPAVDPSVFSRVYWAPSGYLDERMLDKIQVVSFTPPEQLAEPAPLFEFDIDSPFPYFLDSTEVDTAIPDAATVTILNAGGADQLPVFEVTGPYSTFTLQNLDVVDLDGNPLKLVYDDTLPGAVAVAGGDFIEFDFFRNTAYLNGNAANRKAGIDMQQSDFFPLRPGSNRITIAGAAAACKSNGANI